MAKYRRLVLPSISNDQARRGLRSRWLARCPLRGRSLHAFDRLSASTPHNGVMFRRNRGRRGVASSRRLSLAPSRYCYLRSCNRMWQQPAAETWPEKRSSSLRTAADFRISVYCPSPHWPSPKPSAKIARRRLWKPGNAGFDRGAGAAS